ncbi:MAG: RNA-binding protein [Methylobacteriaceae bacterium]|nr:RNA-binding protein [Methylobacteriaceae bacterium]
MPRGPKGEKRPADVIGAAIAVAKIATGEVEEGISADSKEAQTMRSKGGHARATKLTPAQRSEAARLAAAARWKKTR